MLLSHRPAGGAINTVLLSHRPAGGTREPQQRHVRGAEQEPGFGTDGVRAVPEAVGNDRGGGRHGSPAQPQVSKQYRQTPMFLIFFKIYWKQTVNKFKGPSTLG